MQNLRYLKKISRTALTGLFAVTVVVGTSGLEAETKPKNDELELRIDEVEAGLGLRIDEVEEGLGLRINEVEAGLDLRIDELEAEVGELTLALQEQTTVNQNQQAKLRRLHNYVRRQFQANKVRSTRNALKQRLLAARRIMLKRQIDPSQLQTIPLSVLLAEMRKLQDVVETFRCNVTDIPREGADCVDSRGEVIEVDTVETYSEPVMEATTAFIVEAETIPVTYVDPEQLMLEATTPECVLWQSDQTNQVKEDLCAASLGIATDEALEQITKIVEASNNTYEDIVQVTEVLNECTAVVEDSSDAACTYPEDSEAFGSWEGYTIEGDEADPATGGITSSYLLAIGLLQ